MRMNHDEERVNGGRVSPSLREASGAETTTRQVRQDAYSAQLLIQRTSRSLFTAHLEPRNRFMHSTLAALAPQFQPPNVTEQRTNRTALAIRYVLHLPIHRPDRHH